LILHQQTTSLQKPIKHEGHKGTPSESLSFTKSPYAKKWIADFSPHFWQEAD
jgi:hypothetical protein